MLLNIEKKNRLYIRAMVKYMEDKTESESEFEMYLDEEMFLRDAKELLKMAQDIYDAREEAGIESYE